jgi:hypothetical protein
MVIISIPKTLREKLGEAGTDAKKRFEKRLTEEVAGLRVDIADLRGGIQKSKADTIKWMFLFWIGQIGAVLGIILAVFR